MTPHCCQAAKLAATATLPAAATAAVTLAAARLTLPEGFGASLGATGAAPAPASARDGVAALVPGILSFETATQGEVFVALDEGVLVKTGSLVVVSARRVVSDGIWKPLSVTEFWLETSDTSGRTRRLIRPLERTVGV